ncbi:MAG: hypothetical protein ACYSUF_07310 [Planctomycetota bacterium]
MAKTRVLICPYCGEAQTAGERCRGCGGLFEPLSRQATHNAMGPWFVRDPGKPFHPGCSYETLVTMIDRGQVLKTSIIRGPTTKQYWTVAKRVPGVAHLLGYCHTCDATVDPEDHGCHACGVPFGAYLDRNYLGLPEIRPLPWEARMEEGPVGEPHTFSVEAEECEGIAGGISHFASDDELLDDGGTAAARSPAPRAGQTPSRQWARPNPVPEAPVPVPAIRAGAADGRPTVFDDSTSAAVTRALRRRLASQQRMIRVMAVIVVMGLVIALASNLDRLAKLASGGGSSTHTLPGTGDVAASPEDTGEAAIEQLDASITNQQSPEGSPAEAGAPAQETGMGPATGQPGATGGEGVEQAPEAAIMNAYATALELISAAARTDRALDERIGDYARALDSLQSLGRTAPSDQQPGDLTDLIKQVEQELERLRLKEFFG